MSLTKLITPYQANGLFGELYISTDVRSGLTKIGIYDQGYETFTVDEIVAIKSHLNEIILKLKFPKSGEKLPF